MILLLVKFFLIQAFVFGVILFVLRKVLDRKLIVAALGDFEFLRISEEEIGQIKEVEVVSYPILKDKPKEQFLYLVKRKFPKGVPVAFHTDKALMGGIVIRVGKTSINYALVDRLREAGWIKKVKGSIGNVE